MAMDKRDKSICLSYALKFVEAHPRESDRSDLDTMKRVFALAESMADWVDYPIQTTLDKVKSMMSVAIRSVPGLAKQVTDKKVPFENLVEAWESTGGDTDKFIKQVKELMP